MKMLFNSLIILRKPLKTAFIKPYSSSFRLSGLKAILLVLTTLLFQSGCAALSGSTEEASVHTSGQNIFYTGDMTKAGADKFIAALNSASSPITTLVIDSDGGEIGAGMTIGEAILKHNLAVRVENACFSSCANYVLTTAASITLGEGAAYGWHGGAYQPVYIPMSGADSPGLQDYFYRMQPRETALFEKPRVYQAVTVLPMIPGFGAKRNSAIYTYDRETLKALGLDALAEADSQERARCNSKFCTQVFFIPRPLLISLLAKFEKDKAKWDDWLAAEVRKRAQQDAASE